MLLFIDHSRAITISVTEDGGEAARAITAKSVRGSRVTRSMRLVVNLKQRNYNIQFIFVYLH